ncbi:MAG: flagellar hook-associated protein FlgK [Gammaproteobacteria bacterium]
MADVLLTSLSALLSSQRALATTGHNIANFNTPGYSRQRVELGTRIADIGGSGAVGNGVQVMNITRSYDAYLAGSLRDTQSTFNRLDAFHSLSTSIDNLLSDQNAGLAPSMQAFFGAAQDVANDPTSLPARQVFLSQADSIADRFQTVAGRFEDIESEMSARLQQEVDDIEGLAQSIANLNEEIVGASIGTGAPNDLLDSRDRLIDELSTKINISTTVQSDGSVNVQAGNGQTLVTGREATPISVGNDAENPTRLTIVLGSGLDQTDISSSVSGGTLGGIMDFRREVLDPARNEVGRIALAFAAAVNNQQSVGMDLNGNIGMDMFQTSEPAVVASLSNSGSGDVTAGIADVGALTGVDYNLSFSGGAYTLSRADTNEPVTMTGSGTTADPFVADGVSFEVSGTPAEGDSFLVRPTYNAAASLQNVLESPSGVAAAAPLTTLAGIDNTGSGQIVAGAISNPDNPGLLSTTVIEFTSPTTFSINGAGSFPYTENQSINVNGASFELSGSPATGDTFTIDSNAGGVGDNSNMLAIANLQSVGILDGGSSSLVSSIGQLVAEVGSTTRQTGNSLDAQGTLLNQSLERRESISGVNLDEEAANMLRYQQAYEAAAQMITVADSMFATLLNAVGR